MLVLTLVALGLVVQPVLASMGELHELAHAADAAHVAAHSDHGNHGGSLDGVQSTDATTDTAPTGMLHFLMHHAPCCGQSVVPLDASLNLLPTETTGANPARAELRHPPQKPSLAPFRPPILA